MKIALIFCMMLFWLNNTGTEAACTNRKSADKQTCSLGITPKLQAYYLKKVKKEKLKCQQQVDCFKQAINNTLHFLGDDVLYSLIPCLK